MSDDAGKNADGELRNQIHSIWNDFWFEVTIFTSSRIDLQIAGTLMMVRSPRVWSCSRLALTSRPRPRRPRGWETRERPGDWRWAARRGGP